uniref:Secreted protein n=1 Tax=Ascaris lumbricoides TaxID=6252 RepID=A0A0M3HM87_ASCLU
MGVLQSSRSSLVGVKTLLLQCINVELLFERERSQRRRAFMHVTKCIFAAERSRVVLDFDTHNYAIPESDTTTHIHLGMDHHPRIGHNHTQTSAEMDYYPGVRHS